MELYIAEISKTISKHNARLRKVLGLNYCVNSCYFVLAVYEISTITNISYLRHMCGCVVICVCVHIYLEYSMQAHSKQIESGPA